MQFVKRGPAASPLPTPTFSPTTEIYSCGISSHWTSECPYHAERERERGKEIKWKERDYSSGMVWVPLLEIGINISQISDSSSLCVTFNLRGKHKRLFARQQTSDTVWMCVSGKPSGSVNDLCQSVRLRSSASGARKSCPLCLQPLTGVISYSKGMTDWITQWGKKRTLPAFIHNLTIDLLKCVNTNICEGILCVSCCNVW